MPTIPEDLIQIISRALNKRRMTIWLAGSAPIWPSLVENLPQPPPTEAGALFLACIQDGRALGAYENACRRSFI